MPSGIERHELKVAGSTNKLIESDR